MSNYKRSLFVLLARLLVLFNGGGEYGSMLLARASARRRGSPFAWRLAPAACDTRRLLTESLLLAVFGGIGGLLLAVWESSCSRSCPRLVCPGRMKYPLMVARCFTTAVSL